MQSEKPQEPSPSEEGIYDRDPRHLWNRLFAAFYVREVEYTAKSGDPRLEPKKWGPITLDPPLGMHPRFLLDGRTFVTCKDTLEEFLKQSGQDLIKEPLKRTVFQRDLWAVFDVLQSQGRKLMVVESPAPRLTAEQEEHRAILSRLVAQVIRALALPRAELDRLPNTYLLAVKSGVFSKSPVLQKRADYLPSDLEEKSMPWVEILPPEIGPRSKKGLVHTENVRGRSIFRIFAKAPDGVEGEKRFRDWLKSVETALEARARAASGFEATQTEEYHQWQQAMRNVPPGCQFVLIRRMICLDADLNLVPTHLVETVQVRLYRPFELGNPDHIFEEFELDRRALFEGRQGGLVNVTEGEPRPRGYEALGRLSADPEGRIVPLMQFPRSCRGCHMSQDFPTFVISLSGGSKTDRPNPQMVEDQATQWKSGQEEYKRLREFALSGK